MIGAAPQRQDDDMRPANSTASASAPRTILDLRDSPWVDGPGRTVLEIAEGLNRIGFRYVIGALVREGERNEYVEEARRRGLDVITITERSPFDATVIRQVMEAIVRYRAAVVHTHEVRSDVIGLICAKRSRIRLVTTTHGWIANNWKGRLYTALDKIVVRLFDRVVVVSQRMKTQLRRWGVPTAKIEVVPNSLMVDEYRPNRNNQRVRREWGVTTDEIVVACIGRLSPEKGLDVFLRAAAGVLRERSNVRFILIGVGPEEQALRELVAELGIAAHVIFAGYRKDMKQVYDSTDLVVQSSYTEGMPNVILEALLMEVPVVATNVGGTPEVVEHGRHGILIEPGSPGRLAEEILRFIHDRPRFQAMARAGRLRVAHEFDSRKRIERMAHIYNAIMSGST